MPAFRWAIEDTVTTRLSGAASSAGRRWAVHATWPRWFTPNVVSKPSTVTVRERPSIPALLMHRWIGPKRSQASVAAAATCVRSPRSRRRTWTSAPGWRPTISARAATARSSFRQARTVVAPAAAKAAAVSSPMPLLAPVTIATRPCWDGTPPLVNSGVAEAIDRVGGDAVGVELAGHEVPRAHPAAVHVLAEGDPGPGGAGGRGEHLHPLEGVTDALG